MLINCLHALLLLSLLAPGQAARSKDVYSYKFILDCVKQNCFLDIESYRSVCIVLVLDMSCVPYKP